ncbi:transposase family protein [Micromonospora chersina]|uniref:transposase family protein n=1 Tax=Micromonospora chersina TaxID=47854 RepID=UPI0037AB69F1
MIVDGFLAPTGERAGVVGMFSGKRRQVGFNVQAVADLAGRLVDTGLPVPGARHDSKALTESGIADRWASHLRPDGPGMLADLGYLGTNAITGTRKPPGRQLTDVQRACNTAINRLRAAVERCISHLTNWKVLDTGWRGRLTDFPEVLRTVTGPEIYRTWGRTNSE